MLFAQASFCHKATIKNGKVDIVTIASAGVVECDDAESAKQDGIMSLLDDYPEIEGWALHSCTVLPIPDTLVVKEARAIIERDLAELENERKDNG